MLPFLDDTGASYMMLFEEDVIELTELARNPEWSYIRRTTTCTANGLANVEMHKLEVAILSNGQPVTGWVPIKANVKEGSCEPNDYRLSGMWMRQMLYTATAPDNTGRLWLSTTKAGLGRILPDVDAADAQPEVVELPNDAEHIPDLSGPERIAASPESEGAARTPVWVSDAGPELQVPTWGDGRKTIVMEPAIVDSDDSPVWVSGENSGSDSMEVDWQPTLPSYFS